MKKLKPGMIGAVRLADVPANMDPATVKEDERLLPEETKVSWIWSRFLQYLAEIGFDGICVDRLSASQPRAAGSAPRPVGAARERYAFSTKK